MVASLNTAVLLISSFTMAWGVRAAQKGQKQLLIVLLAITFVGGCLFMTIKGIEYYAKFSHGIGPGTANLFYGAEHADEEKLAEIHHIEKTYGLIGDESGHGEAAAGEHAPQAESATASATSNVNHGESAAAPKAGNSGQGETSNAAAMVATADGAALPSALHSNIAKPAHAPDGFKAETPSPTLHAGGHDKPVTFSQLSKPTKARVHIFFQTYFLMTGLHGLHVLIGMGLICWIAIRADQGRVRPRLLYARRSRRPLLALG